ncbi:ABC transporter ATP-binding protein [Cryobacterium sp. Y11]|uniref:ABC transporter ATP-binding protein n=1 Tax=Cryobacterium sp. Y11 TaxID=2045016 RepID=UPI000CE3C89F|nr:ABC transporter ATP-binding protein [Cryobacterium sp. Y11]
MTAILEARGVSLQRGGLKILSDLHISVEENAVTGVIGPNGAGKTSLFNVLSGFMKLDGGDVLFEGKSLVGLRPEAVCRRGVARTFQRVRGYPALSVRENVMVGTVNRLPRREAEALASELLTAVELDALADQPAEILSVGNRKRLEVARVLATGAKVVLLDEVMGGLVPVEVQQMMELIVSLKQRGITVVLIEHHMSAVMGVSDHIYVIQRGKNLADGTPAEIARNDAVIAAYLGKEYTDAEI